MKKINYSLLSGALALSAASGVISVASSKKDATVVSAASLSTLVNRQLVWSTATSDTNFEWSAPLRTVNDFNYGWVGLSTQYFISNFTWKYKNNEKNIVDSMTFTKMYFDTNNSSASLSVTVSTIVDGEVKKTQAIPATHISSPDTHWVSNNIVTVTGLSSLVGNKQVSFKFEATGSTTRFGFVKDEYFSVTGYASTKVTLDNQGGSTNSSVYLVEGYPMPNVSVPTKEDHEFDGYYSEVEGGGTKYYNANGTPALSTAGDASTLYAKWNRVGTNITLDKEGGTGGDDSTLGVLDQTLPDIAVPSKSGYTFNGYYSQKDGKGIQYYNNQGKSSFVWNSEDTAVTFYASWTIKPEVENAINKINQIGTVTYSEDSLAKLNDAQAAYDAVGNTDKAGVSNSATLSDGWNTYNSLKQAGADAVKGLINAIGIVTLEKEDDILAARDAYNALTSEQKELVTNYSTLTTAEARLAELKANKAAADVVVAKINAIGEVSYPESKALIDEARVAYDALENAEQEGFVSNYATLTTAESTYASLRQQGIDDAEALVNALGTITLEKENDIVAARAAYEALTEEQKNKYDGDVLATLVAAEARLEELKANKAAADVVVAKIDAIGEVSYPESKALIDEARAAYDALENAEQEGFVSNYSTLTSAESQYASLRQQGIADAEDLVLAIGEVTLEKGEQIKAAREAYEALTEEQKGSYKQSILEALVAAEAEFKVLDDQDKANASKALIEAIGAVEYSETCKGKIDAARAGYDALSLEAKALVDNYQKLVDAEYLYGKIQNVVSKIENIGEVTKKQESKDKIDDARAAYDALSEEEKALLPDHKLAALRGAEEKYAELTKGLAAWAVVLIVIGSLLVACGAFLLVMFLCFPKFVVDHYNNKVVRAIYVKKHHNIVLLLKTNLRFTEVHEADVYKTIEEAERGLKK